MNKIIVILLALSVQGLNAQKYFSKTGKVSFYSEAAMEKIEAVLDATTGAIEWGVLVKGFAFDKALMQEHFNENYMESESYPKAKFKGKIDQPEKVVYTKDGVYPVTISGQLEMHGVTKTITVPATIAVKNGALSAKSKITLALADYGIEIPKLVKENISEKVTIEISADYQIMGGVQ
jgi:polyisoprenoid-binding protein YceI